MENISLLYEAVNAKTSSDRLFELAKISTELAQLVAQNPSTPSELLRKLASSGEAIARSRIAANPNTPIEVLQELADEFPKEVLDNPVFPLLSLENPNILDKLFQPNTLWNLVLDVQTPKEILRMLAHCEHPEIVEAARLHVNLAGEMTTGWDKAGCEAIGTADWREAVGTTDSVNSRLSSLARRGFIPEFAIEQLAKHQRWRIRAFVADKLNTPVKLLEQLAQDLVKDVRGAVARNLNIPLKLLEQLAQDRERYVCESVAQNPNTPIELLEQLVRDNGSYIRKHVAQNPNAPVQLLEQLARDEYYSPRESVATRESVAKNPNAPVKLLKELARDEESSVRTLVAQNPNAPVKLLEQLARDRDDDVRDSVVANPNSPLKLLERLARDRNKFRRRRDQSKFRRGYVAKNPITPTELLEQLARDKQGYVRQHVAANPNTSVQLLEQLAQDKDERVRGCVAQNLNAPVNFFLKAMLKDCPRDSSPSLIRFLVLLHSQTPSEILADNLGSQAWLERYAIARNTNSPINTLQVLAKDANRIVRAAAKANLESRPSNI
jgi:3-methyladenine DNA glycosylase AlkC